MAMKFFRIRSKRRARKASFGFTLVETVVAAAVAATMLSAHYLGFAAGFAILTVTREDLRATQIMLQRLEAIRLSGMAQLLDPTKYPPTATEYYDEQGKTNGNGGVAYTVTYSAIPGSSTNLTILPPSYRTNVLEVTVGVSWQSGKVTRNRSMRTYVARNGIQSYVSGGY
jgi:type II secretory pathway pseudopilin PulG